MQKIKKNIQNLLENALKTQNKKIGLLFSGGIDSTLIALILKKLKKEFTCYVAVLDEPSFKQAEDLEYSRKVAKKLNLDLKIIKIKLNEIEATIKKIIPIINKQDVINIGVALPIFFSCQKAKQDKCDIVLSGLGADELFAGYKTHREAQDINKHCLERLNFIKKNDMKREEAIANHFKLKIDFPFTQLTDYALNLNPKLKIKNNINKYILRLLAQNLGLSKEFAFRKKRAAQYGSNFHKALKKLAKGDYIKDYLESLSYNLAALISSGKDSIFATYLMIKRGYNVNSLITIKSLNKESFMYHTPSIDLAKLQAKAMNLPIIFQTSKGQKEKELKELKEALQIAKKKYKINGIITGALFSEYQKQRIDKLCKDLKLKHFAPLWHMDQETELKELLKNKFEVILTTIAADGFDESFLGKKIDSKFIDHLVKLHQKTKINIAFEGGEAESLVLDCPIFKQKLKIEKTEKIMENSYTGILKIKAKLIKK